MTTPAALARISEARLSSREVAVLQLAASGLTNNRIGAHLHLAVDTVKTHLRRAFVKLGARDRAQAVAVAIARGYLVPHEDGTITVPAAHQEGGEAA